MAMFLLATGAPTLGCVSDDSYRYEGCRSRSVGTTALDDRGEYSRSVSEVLEIQSGTEVPWDWSTGTRTMMVFEFVLTHSGPAELWKADDPCSEEWAELEFDIVATSADARFDQTFGANIGRVSREPDWVYFAAGVVAPLPGAEDGDVHYLELQGALGESDIGVGLFFGASGDPNSELLGNWIP